MKKESKNTSDYRDLEIYLVDSEAGAISVFIVGDTQGPLDGSLLTGVFTETLFFIC